MNQAVNICLDYSQHFRTPTRITSNSAMGEDRRKDRPSRKKAMSQSRKKALTYAEIKEHDSSNERHSR